METPGLHLKVKNLKLIDILNGRTRCAIHLITEVTSVLAQSVKTAFGNNNTPTWNDFMLFLEDRCIPRQRSGLREYLNAIGVSSYNPLEIIKKTAGHMAEDNQWISMEVYNQL